MLSLECPIADTLPGCWSLGPRRRDAEVRQPSLGLGVVATLLLGLSKISGGSVVVGWWLVIQCGAHTGLSQAMDTMDTRFHQFSDP